MSYEIIDSHVHFWEPERVDRPWHPGGVILGPPLSVDHLLADAFTAGVTKIVQVTPSVMGFDNRHGIEEARRHSDRIVGVIGRFDPTLPELPERLAEFASEPAVLGVRVTLIKEWTEWLRDGILEPLMHEAGKIGLRVQLYGPYQSSEMLAAAKRHPDTTFLIDHTALDHYDSNPFKDWPNLLQLALAANVYTKVSYFPEASKDGYPFRTAMPFFRELFERVGPDRLIWGSNYPPSAAASTYAHNIDFIQTQATFLEEDDKAKIFGGTFLKALGNA